MSMSRKNTIYLWSIILIVSCAGMSYATNVTAHKPMFVELWYELEPPYVDEMVENRLNVIITHGVTDTESHYVETVEIFINDVLIETHYYENQSSTTSLEANWHNQFELIYDGIIAVEDDHIRVVATCNIEGFYENEIHIGHPHIHHEHSFLNAIMPSIIITIGILFPLVWMHIKNKRMIRQSIILQRAFQ